MAPRIRGNRRKPKPKAKPAKPPAPPKPKLRDLSRTPPTREEAVALAEVFYTSSASPIVMAILGQSLVEIDLDKLLRAKFALRNDQTWAALTDDKGPLSTFASKITCGHAFRLYDDITKENLNKLKNIRNAFAHTKRMIDFDNPLVLKELQSIKLPHHKHGQYKYAKEAKEVKRGGADSFVRLFTYLSLILIVRDTKKLTAKQRYHKRKSQQRFRAGGLFALGGLGRPGLLGNISEGGLGTPFSWDDIKNVLPDPDKE